MLFHRLISFFSFVFRQLLRLDALWNQVVNLKLSSQPFYATSSSRINCRSESVTWWQRVWSICHVKNILGYNFFLKKSLKLTFLGLRGTRSLSLFIPGITIVILLGPFIPKTFVSCCHMYVNKKTGNKQRDKERILFSFSFTSNKINPVAAYSQVSIICSELLETHVDDACQLLPCIRHVWKGSLWIQSVVKDGELGPH